MDKPRLLTPDIGKMDLHRLLSDLPKFKPWLYPSAWSELEHFISTIDDLSRVPDICWEIHKLISAAIVSTNSRCNPVLSEDLTQMLDTCSSLLG